MSLEFLQEVIRDYGYVALFIGTFLEGETILLLAGFAVQTGQFGLELQYIILTAFVGSLSGDQTAFTSADTWEIASSDAGRNGGPGSNGCMRCSSGITAS
jgi:membrane protein DedA with SNARE-associated domain